MEEKILFDVIYAPRGFQSQNTPLMVGRRYHVVDIVDSPDHWGLKVRLKGYPNELFPEEFFSNAHEYKQARIDYPWVKTTEEIEKIVESRVPFSSFETLEEETDGTPFWEPQKSSLLPILDIRIIGFGQYIVTTRTTVYKVETVYKE